MEKIAIVTELFRYPVKSMAGESLDTASLGWSGVDGDRRYAFRRVADTSGFPWLSAGRWPRLLSYRPVRLTEDGSTGEPTHVRSPHGRDLGILSAELNDEVSSESGFGVEMMRLKHGIFDDAPISVITAQTIREISRVADISVDTRRFRPNVLIDLQQASAFREDAWVGRTLVFGDREHGARVAVTMPDLRCSMVNLDPDSIVSSPAVLKATARLNETNAGVYGCVTRAAVVRVGDAVFLD